MIVVIEKHKAVLFLFYWFDVDPGYKTPGKKALGKKSRKLFVVIHLHKK